MPKRVPADLANACPRRGRLQVPVENALLPAGSARIVGEDPVLWPRIRAALSQLVETAEQIRMAGERPARSLGLGIADPAVHITPLHHDRGRGSRIGKVPGKRRASRSATKKATKSSKQAKAPKRPAKARRDNRPPGRLAPWLFAALPEHETLTPRRELSTNRERFDNWQRRGKARDGLQRGHMI